MSALAAPAKGIRMCGMRDGKPFEFERHDLEIRPAFDAHGLHEAYTTEFRAGGKTLGFSQVDVLTVQRSFGEGLCIRMAADEGFLETLGITEVYTVD